MKRPEPLPRAVAARLIATKAREDYAAKVLHPDEIIGAMLKASSEGFCMVRLAFDRPLDLRETAAAAKLAEVGKREGFELDWVTRMSLGRENVTGCDVMGHDLVVRW